MPRLTRHSTSRSGACHAEPGQDPIAGQSVRPCHATPSGHLHAIAAASLLVGEIGIENREVGDAELPIDLHLLACRRQSTARVRLSAEPPSEGTTPRYSPTGTHGDVVGGILHDAQRLLGVPRAVSLVAQVRLGRLLCIYKLMMSFAVDSGSQCDGDLKGGVGVLLRDPATSCSPRASPVAERQRQRRPDEQHRHLLVFGAGSGVADGSPAAVTEPAPSKGTVPHVGHAATVVIDPPPIGPRVPGSVKDRPSPHAARSIVREL